MVADHDGAVQPQHGGRIRSASPGDEHHPEPYLYVATWSVPPAGPLWNATAFGGAELGYPELIASADRRATAHDFFRSRLEALTG